MAELPKEILVPAVPEEEIPTWQVNPDIERKDLPKPVRDVLGQEERRHHPIDVPLPKQFPDEPKH